METRWIWESKKLHEHPAKHQKGTYGKIKKSRVGIYCLSVGGCVMSCPQNWAAKIEHADEQSVAVA